MSLHVLIAGGGIGGLCLAQGMRQKGIRVDVYERDASIDSRGQGYRFRIDPDGDAALRECLPANVYDLYRATANQPSCPPIGAYDAHLNLIYRFPPPPNSGGTDQKGLGNHVAVHRRTLRQVLLGGLEEVMHFDHTLIGFQQDDDGVRMQFADGSAASGDLLVAADGIHSVSRRQMLPHASLLETDMECVYGTTLLNDEILEGMPEPLFAGFTPIIGPDRTTLAMGMYRPCCPFAEAVAE